MTRWCRVPRRDRFERALPPADSKDGPRPAGAVLRETERERDMQKHESEGLPPEPGNNNRPPGDRTRYWLGIVIATLLALIAVQLIKRWF